MALPLSQLGNALSAFPPTVQAELHELIFKYKVVPSTRSTAWCDIMGISIEDLMVLLLPLAAGCARVPISGNPQGAVVLGHGGQTGKETTLYLGSNLELPGAGPQFGLHAAQTALHLAWLAGATGVQALALAGPPCGTTRQSLEELPSNFRIYIADQGEASSPRFHTSFSREFLYPEPPHRGQGQGGSWLVPEVHDLPEVKGDSLVAHALEAAKRSYAPVSRAFAGVALLRSDGKVVTGRYAENASLSAGQGPMLSAVGNLLMSLPPQDAFDIERAVLVEARSRIGHQRGALEVLQAVAPRVPLEYHLVAGT